MSKFELHNGNSHAAEVPREIAICPECRSALVVYSSAWDDDTGEVLVSGLDVQCYQDDVEDAAYFHRYYQSDWQIIVDRVAAWCGAIQGR